MSDSFNSGMVDFSNEHSEYEETDKATMGDIDEQGYGHEDFEQQSFRWEDGGRQ